MDKLSARALSWAASGTPAWPAACGPVWCPGACEEDEGFTLGCWVPPTPSFSGTAFRSLEAKLRFVH